MNGVETKIAHLQMIRAAENPNADTDSAVTPTTEHLPRSGHVWTFPRVVTMSPRSTGI